jgi:hypothetical protein
MSRESSSDVYFVRAASTLGPISTSLLRSNTSTNRENFFLPCSIQKGNMRRPTARTVPPLLWAVLELQALELLYWLCWYCTLSEGQSWQYNFTVASFQLTTCSSMFACSAGCAGIFSCLRRKGRSLGGD